MTRASTHHRLLLAAAALALLAGCTLGVAENSPGGGAINIETVPLVDVAERQPAPDVCGETLEGDELCLADLTGTPVLVNFWASWCGPCAAEVPELVDVADAYDGQVSVIGVNTQDSRTNARSFERDQGVDYPSFFDPGAAIAAQFGGIAPEALPSTILVDADGGIAVRLLGAVSRPQLEPYLAELIADA
ncbi:TlpA family protein disulfide reductase [Euzebya sp.]|uniref:TlpA family protein disulfide reductase n=1 Tax=Euzebya sp. TaxID=1971409 RepID=UPI0035115207